MLNNYQILTQDSKEYPFWVRNFLPELDKLYALGSIKKRDEKAIAVVGTRNMTSYGKKATIYFVEYFAKKGFTIISGLARGVDTIAHKTALKNKARTIAVLGSGIDIIYPPENKDLATEISKKGAVITNFSPGTKPFGKNFLARNRIIAALGLAALVIEGKRKSGTISTATHAANMGKEVFAVPGPFFSAMSEAPHFLISNGATLAITPKDVIDSIL